jgi:hypothetical protein
MAWVEVIIVCSFGLQISLFTSAGMEVDFVSSGQTIRPPWIEVQVLL